MSNTAVWAWANTGSKVHAFVQMMEGSVNHKRAMCRKTITRNADAIFRERTDTGYPGSICPNCEKKFDELIARAEASMMPATEAHDLGYVAPVDQRADEDAVAEALNSPAVIDALHAEAIEMDRQREKEENVAQEARRIAGRSTTGPLNDTQHEIMKRVVQGATYQDIADERGWTRNAVADNIRVAVAKMNVPNSTAAAARYAQYLLLVQLQDELEGLLSSGNAEWVDALNVVADRLETILP
jgi:DNA-binding CsgD family transcriptional regulator